MRTAVDRFLQYLRVERNASELTIKSIRGLTDPSKLQESVLSAMEAKYGGVVATSRSLSGSSSSSRRS